MGEKSEADLVKKLQRGNKQAFRKYYNRYHVQLYYIAKKYVKDKSLAEDAVQEVYIKFWEKREKLDASKSVKGYLFTMLKNHVLNMVRNRKRDIVSAIPVRDNMSSSNSTEENIAYRDSRKLVEQGLEGLSDRKKEVFRMKVFNGYTNSEVAEILDISIRTVKTHYYNGSKYIRNFLKNYYNL